MIFALSAKGQKLFVFLTPDDFKKLKDGHTLFVDEHHLGKEQFNGVILAFGKGNEDVKDMIRQAGNVVTDDNMVYPKPEGNEMVCEGCKGIIKGELLYHKRCIVCWANEAKRYRATFN